MKLHSSQALCSWSTAVYPPSDHRQTLSAQYVLFRLFLPAFQDPPSVLGISSQKKSMALPLSCRRRRASTSRFRVALAIASLPGMTIDYVTNFRDTIQANSLQSQFRPVFLSGGENPPPRRPIFLSL